MLSKSSRLWVQVWDCRANLPCSSNVVGIVCSVLTPYMVNPSEWNWKKLTAFFWVSLTMFIITWCI
jgi:hypothetical protein